MMKPVFDLEYWEVELDGYKVIFHAVSDDAPPYAFDAVTEMHISWKGKNPGVDVPMRLQDLANLRKTLLQVERKLRRKHKQ